MKKRILFVIDSLNIGGAERSLVSLLSLFDYSKYDVDVQLFGYNGAFEQYLPKEVNLLPPLDYTKFLSKSLLAQLCSCKVKYIFARLAYSLAIRINRGSDNPDKAMLLWSYSHNCFNGTDYSYDVAIAYAQSLPTLYVVDKVSARKKIGWVNVNYVISSRSQRYLEQYYNELDAIVTVSESVRECFSAIYGQFSFKMTTIMDILNPDLLYRMADEQIPFEIKTDRPIIVTVARLNDGQKGMDITVEVARSLYERGVNFCWYIVGEGSYRNQLNTCINEYNLGDTVFLLGAVANPYPIMKRATIYVQTSRYEGFGLSIAEARMLNIPVVTTAYDGVYMQMVPDCNGVVVPIDACAVADTVQRLLENPNMRDKISSYQRSEKKGNIEEIEKVYSLL
jgi:glycosyltransferase involved in cell wall biosynthesis